MIFPNCIPCICLLDKRLQTVRVSRRHFSPGPFLVDMAIEEQLFQWHSPVKQYAEWYLRHSLYSASSLLAAVEWRRTLLYCM